MTPSQNSVIFVRNRQFFRLHILQCSCYVRFVESTKFFGVKGRFRVGKNIIVFSDGTGQVGGLKPEQRLSNIYKLYRACRIDPLNDIDPSKQVAFYDAGLGTDADAESSGTPKFLRWLRKVMGSASGRGISRNIADCYEFIINNWQPGDRIWIFGFSRGAYTARCVGNLVSLCGVPTADNEGNPLAKYRRSTRKIADEAVRDVYEHGAGYALKDFEEERTIKASRFRVKYGSGTVRLPNADPYFIGVFDTVAALGSRGIRRFGWIMLMTILVLIISAVAAAPIALFTDLDFWPAAGTIALTAAIVAGIRLWRGARRTIVDYPEVGQFRSHSIRWKAENYDRGLGRRVKYARHAISIDERRSDFPRVGWGKSDVIRRKFYPEDEPLIQLWFAGNHSDIGGSYPENESRLSDITLEWMLLQATDELFPFKLEFDATRLNLFPSADGMQHCEVIALNEKFSWVPKIIRPGWGVKSRKGSLGAPLHQSVFDRFSLPFISQCGVTEAYRPETLKRDNRFSEFYQEIC